MAVNYALHFLEVMRTSTLPIWLAAKIRLGDSYTALFMPVLATECGRDGMQTKHGPHCNNI